MKPAELVRLQGPVFDARTLRVVQLDIVAAVYIRLVVPLGAAIAHPGAKPHRVPRAIYGPIGHDVNTLSTLGGRIPHVLRPLLKERQRDPSVTARDNGVDDRAILSVFPAIFDRPVLVGHLDRVDPVVARIAVFVAAPVLVDAHSGIGQRPTAAGVAHVNQPAPLEVLLHDGDVRDHQQRAGDVVAVCRSGLDDVGARLA